MPELIEISGFGKVKSKKRKKTVKKSARKGAKKARKTRKKSIPKVSFKEVTKTQMKRTAQSIKKASIKKAVGGLRLSITALTKGKWAKAANMAYNAGIEAVAAHKKDPHMAARVITAARNIIKFSIKRMKKHNV